MRLSARALQIRHQLARRLDLNHQAVMELALRELARKWGIVEDEEVSERGETSPQEEGQGK